MSRPGGRRGAAMQLENILWRSDEQMFESACHEGNLGLAGILSGARAAEKR